MLTSIVRSEKELNECSPTEGDAPGRRRDRDDGDGDDAAPGGGTTLRRPTIDKPSYPSDHTSQQSALV